MQEPAADDARDDLLQEEPESDVIEADPPQQEEDETIDVNDNEAYTAFVRDLIARPREERERPAPIVQSLPALEEIELIEDPEDIDGQLRVARQLQLQGMAVLERQAERIKEYSDLLEIQDDDITKLRQENDELRTALNTMVEDNQRLRESFQKLQTKNALLQQDADHWRVHKLAEDRRKAINGSRMVQQGNKEYRQLLEKLRDKG